MSEVAKKIEQLKKSLIKHEHRMSDKLVLKLSKGVLDDKDNISMVSVLNEGGLLVGSLTLIEAECRADYLSLAKKIGEEILSFLETEGHVVEVSEDL